MRLAWIGIGCFFLFFGLIAPGEARELSLEPNSTASASPLLSSCLPSPPNERGNEDDFSLAVAFVQAAQQCEESSLFHGESRYFVAFGISMIGDITKGLSGSRNAQKRDKALKTIIGDGYERNQNWNDPEIAFATAQALENFHYITTDQGTLTRIAQTLIEIAGQDDQGVSMMKFARLAALRALQTYGDSAHNVVGQIFEIMMTNSDDDIAGSAERALSNIRIDEHDTAHFVALPESSPCIYGHYPRNVELQDSVEPIYESIQECLNTYRARPIMKLRQAMATDMLAEDHVAEYYGRLIAIYRSVAMSQPAYALKKLEDFVGKLGTSETDNRLRLESAYELAVIASMKQPPLTSLLKKEVEYDLVQYQSPFAIDHWIPLLQWIKNRALQMPFHVGGNIYEARGTEWDILGKLSSYDKPWLECAAGDHPCHISNFSQESTREKVREVSASSHLALAIAGDIDGKISYQDSPYRSFAADLKNELDIQPQSDYKRMIKSFDPQHHAFISDVLARLPNDWKETFGEEKCASDALLLYIARETSPDYDLSTKEESHLKQRIAAEEKNLDELSPNSEENGNNVSTDISAHHVDCIANLLHAYLDGKKTTEKMTMASDVLVHLAQQETFDHKIDYPNSSISALLNTIELNGISDQHPVHGEQKENALIFTLADHIGKEYDESRDMGNTLHPHLELLGAISQLTSWYNIGEEVPAALSILDASFHQSHSSKAFYDALALYVSHNSPMIRQFIDGQESDVQGGVNTRQRIEDFLGVLQTWQSPCHISSPQNSDQECSTLERAIMLRMENDLTHIPLTNPQLDSLLDISSLGSWIGDFGRTSAIVWKINTLNIPMLVRTQEYQKLRDVANRIAFTPLENFLIIYGKIALSTFILMLILCVLKKKWIPWSLAGIILFSLAFLGLCPLNTMCQQKESGILLITLIFFLAIFFLPTSFLVVWNVPLLRKLFFPHTYFFFCLLIAVTDFLSKFGLSFFGESRGARWLIQGCLRYFKKDLFPFSAPELSTDHLLHWTKIFRSAILEDKGIGHRFLVQGDFTPHQKNEFFYQLSISLLEREIAVYLLAEECVHGVLDAINYRVNNAFEKPLLQVFVEIGSMSVYIDSFDGKSSRTQEKIQDFCTTFPLCNVYEFIPINSQETLGQLATQTKHVLLPPEHEVTRS